MKLYVVALELKWYQERYFRFSCLLVYMQCVRLATGADVQFDLWKDGVDFTGRSKQFSL
jgi:hypothetical protein